MQAASHPNICQHKPHAPNTLTRARRAGYRGFAGKGMGKGACKPQNTQAGLLCGFTAMSLFALHFERRRGLAGPSLFACFFPTNDAGGSADIAKTRSTKSERTLSPNSAQCLRASLNEASRPPASYERCIASISSFVIINIMMPYRARRFLTSP